MDATTEPTQEQKRVSSEDASQLAAALLWNDRRKLLGVLLLLALPGFGVLLFDSEPAWLVVLELVGRVIALLALFWVGRRTLEQFGYSAPIANQHLVRIIIAGFALWGLVAVPGALAVLAPGPLQMLGLILLIPGIALSLRYFFFFVPVLLNVSTPVEVLDRSAELTAGDRLLPIRALIAPLGWMVILVAGLRSLTHTDPNSTETVMYEVVASVFPLLSIYLSLGFGILALSDARSREAGFHPYWREHAKTLSLGMPAFLPRLLTPRRGVFLFLAGSLWWLITDIRVAHIPPTDTIAVESVQAFDSELHLGLLITPPLESASSTLPAQFRLATKGGQLVSTTFPKVEIDGKEWPVGRSLAELPGAQHVLLIFDTDLSERELKKAGDIYLWYRAVQLDPVRIPLAEEKSDAQDEENGEAAHLDLSESDSRDSLASTHDSPVSEPLAPSP